MRSFAFATVLAAANAVSDIELDYLNHCAKFGRQHVSMAQFEMRLARFAKVDAFIKESNAANWTHVAGHNQFSDWTHVEYKAMLGYVRDDVRAPATLFDESSNDTAVNWVDAGAVTGVKDQGQCGSCWAFGTTGSLEGAHFVATGELLSFSEQQLVDCASFTGYGNLGCYGGLATYAYNYYMDGNMAELESVYPYTSGTGQMTLDCQYDELSQTAVTVSTYANVTADSPSQMKAALVQQPLAVGIEADKMVFQTYTSGVLSSASCGTNLDHAVLVVGDGTENGQAYWLVKNSWNTTWGDQGYIKLAKDSTTGTCGVQMEPQAPTTN